MKEPEVETKRLIKESTANEERKSDATSKETVKDLEQSNTTSDSKGVADQTSLPAPDGSPEFDRGARRPDGSHGDAPT